MIRVLTIACITPAILSIIINDSPKEFQYRYSYNIDDPTTGDSKSQSEERSGDTVIGSYSVLDPDGTKRIVEYTADPKNGFNAIVHTLPALDTKTDEYPTFAADSDTNMYATRSYLYTSIVQPIQFSTDPAPLSLLYPEEKQDRKTAK